MDINTEHCKGRVRVVPPTSRKFLNALQCYSIISPLRSFQLKNIIEFFHWEAEKKRINQPWVQSGRRRRKCQLKILPIRFSVKPLHIRHFSLATNYPRLLAYDSCCDWSHDLSKTNLSLNLTSSFWVYILLFFQAVSATNRMISFQVASFMKLNVAFQHIYRAESCSW